VAPDFVCGFSFHLPAWAGVPKDQNGTFFVNKKSHEYEPAGFFLATKRSMEVVIDTNYETINDGIMPQPHIFWKPCQKVRLVLGLALKLLRLSHDDQPLLFSLSSFHQLISFLPLSYYVFLESIYAVFELFRQDNGSASYRL
jgi:hypothetical protein